MNPGDKLVIELLDYSGQGPSPNTIYVSGFMFPLRILEYIQSYKFNVGDLVTCTGLSGTREIKCISGDLAWISNSEGHHTTRALSDLRLVHARSLERS